MAYSRIGESGGEYSLTFSCENLPADAVVIDAGHQPSGYFWEGIATLIAPEIMQVLESDSDSDLFKVIGLRADLEELRNKLEPMISRPEAIRATLARADSEGFELHD